MNKQQINELQRKRQESYMEAVKNSKLTPEEQEKVKRLLIQYRPEIVKNKENANT